MLVPESENSFQQTGQGHGQGLGHDPGGIVAVEKGPALNGPAR